MVLESPAEVLESGSTGAERTSATQSCPTMSRSVVMNENHPKSSTIKHGLSECWYQIVENHSAETEHSTGH